MVDTASPTPSTPSTPIPPTPAKKARTFKTWHVIVVGVVGLGIGTAAGGGSNDSKVKDAQAQLASTKTQASKDVDAAKGQASKDVAAANTRAEQAEANARGKIEKDYAAQKTELDKRAASLDAKDADLVKREQAVGIRQKEIDANSFEDGTYEVGVDIKPGTYKTQGGSGCYWEKNTGGSDIHSIIDNDNASGPVTVIIEASTKFFKTERCGTWTKSR